MFSGIWRSSVLNVSKQKLLTPTNATLLGWTKSFLFRLRFRIFVVSLAGKDENFSQVRPMP